ncbi:immunoglobulin kappa light chain-like [Chiloscyllium punctatum]|uniref:immunoglobulin kappa light chain-like n=1 Tax=Chiloscyllium punctatum TaxID=137246 RepID=UPI003B641077
MLKPEECSVSPTTSHLTGSFCDSSDFTVFLSDPSGISGDIIMTQSPPVLSVGLGQTATITCKSSQSASGDVEWYQQREGQKPSLLIYNAATRFTGVSNRFTGTEVSSTHFTLTISNVQNEDVADYYCQQSESWPFTFGKGTKLRRSRDNSQPKLTLLPPSPEQIDAKGTATLVCLANHLYPDELEERAMVSHEFLEEDLTVGQDHVLGLSTAVPQENEVSHKEKPGCGGKAQADQLGCRGTEPGLTNELRSFRAELQTQAFRAAQLTLLLTIAP